MSAEEHLTNMSECETGDQSFAVEFDRGAAVAASAASDDQDGQRAKQQESGQCCCAVGQSSPEQMSQVTQLCQGLDWRR